MRDRNALRIPAALLVSGEALFILAGVFHPAHEDANDHHAVFAEYAHSHNWTLVHLGQFAGLTLVLAGILALIVALDVDAGPMQKFARLTAVSAIVTIALYAVLQAVDGVALKHSVDAWLTAPQAEQTAAFHSAESIRWLEWGVRSYQQVMQGATLVLLGTLIAGTNKLPKTIGYLAGLSGIAYIVQGLIIGSDGFSATADTPGLAALVLQAVWIIWIAVIATTGPYTESQPSDVVRGGHYREAVG